MTDQLRSISSFDVAPFRSRSDVLVNDSIIEFLFSTILAVLSFGLASDVGVCGSGGGASSGDGGPSSDAYAQKMHQPLGTRDPSLRRDMVNHDLRL